MIIQTIRAKGIGPYKNEFIFEPYKLASKIAIMGRNGRGKTFLLEMIPGVLYGFFPFRMHKSQHSIYELVAKNDESYIEMYFQFNGKSYRINRNFILKGEYVGADFIEKSKNHMAGIFEYDFPEKKWETRASGADLTTKWVEENIMTKEMFLTSCFHSQNSAEEIVAKTATERKRIFADLIGLDHIQERSVFFNERTKQVQKIVDEIASQIIGEKKNLLSDEQAVEIERFNAQAQVDIDGFQEAIQSLVKVKEELVQEQARNEMAVKKFNESRSLIVQLEKDIAAIESELTKANTDVQSKQIYEKQIEELDRFRTERNELEPKAKLGSDINLKIQQHENLKKETLVAIAQKKRDVQDAIKSLEQSSELKLELNKAEQDYKDFTRQRDDAEELKTLDCPATCGYVEKARTAKKWLDEHKGFEEELESRIAAVLQKIEANGSKARQHAAELEAGSMFKEENERLAKIESNLLVLSGKKKQVDEVVSQHNKLVENIRKIEALGFDKKLQKIAESETQIGILKEKLGAKKKALQQTQEDVVAQPAVSTGSPAAIQNEIDGKQKSIEDLRRTININEHKLELSDDAQFSCSLLEKDKTKFETLALAYTEEEKAFSTNGVQALVIDSEKMTFLDIAKELFDILTGGDMKLIFDTQKTLRGRRGGEKVESFELLLEVDGIRRPLELTSQGQQDLARLVMRATLGIYFSIKGSRMQSYFLDETTGSLDAVNRQGYIGFLDYLAKYFTQIFVVSHQDVTQFIPCHITVDDKHNLNVVDFESRNNAVA